MKHENKAGLKARICKAYFSIIISIACGIALDVEAEIYKWKDASGQMHYTTTPPPSADAKATGIQTEYSQPPKPVVFTPKFKPKPRKEPEQIGPQVITIGSGKNGNNGLCDTASNGFLSNHGRSGDALQDNYWKKCRGMK
jgi:hypothetical protein